MKESNILIVDDEEHVLSSLKRELQDEPYNVFVANSGEAALNILNANVFKVVLSDVKMPGMDGFELFEKVNELYPDTVKVILSGFSNVHLILSIVNAKQIDRYVTKPWNSSDVKIIITQSIELYDLRKEVIDLRNEVNELRQLLNTPSVS